MNTPMMQARYDLGFDPEMMISMVENQPHLLAGLHGIKSKGMLPTKFGDAVAIITGGWAVYKYHYDNAYRKAVAGGSGDAEARQIAHEAGSAQFEKSTNRYQQSGNMPDLPPWMRKGDLLRLFTMYMTGPNSIFRMEFTGWTNLARGRGSKPENIKKIILGHFILPMFFQLAANGFRWKDDEEAAAAIIGSLNGILLLGPFIEETARGMAAAFTGRRPHGEPSLVSSQAIEATLYVSRALFQIAKMAGTEDWNEADLLKAADNMARGVAVKTGVPYAMSKRYVQLAQDVQAGKDVGYMRYLGYSPTALGENESKGTSTSAGRGLPRSRVGDRSR